MKVTFLAFLICASTMVLAQNPRYNTRSAAIKFEASVPSFEPIEATNKSATIVLDTNTGAIASLVLLKGFKFPIALMEEHFNENYVESDEFPKAILKGNLQQFDSNSVFINKKSNFTFNGSLDMHGVKNEISFPIIFAQTDNGIQINASFKVNPEDYNIEIPSVVAKKIADEIQVTVTGILNTK